MVDLPPNLPLWLENDQDGFLKSLSVARATGGGVFKITSPQWQRLMEYAGWSSLITQIEGSGIGGETAEEKETAGGGQNILTDSPKRRLIEEYAMSRAKDHFDARGYKVTPKGKPYDLHCTRGEELLYVEVKGTQTDAEEILLTPNGIEFAEAHQNQMALFVVRNIRVVGIGTTLSAEGGYTALRMHWRPNRERLTAVSYSYRLEEKGTSATTAL